MDLIGLGVALMIAAILLGSESIQVYGSILTLIVFIIGFFIEAFDD